MSCTGVFRNTGDGTFTNVGAVGLAVGDYEHDGDLDLFVTRWLAQENALFENGWSRGRK